MVGLRFSFEHVSLQIALGKISLDDCGLITTLKVDSPARKAVIGPLKLSNRFVGFAGEAGRPIIPGKAIEILFHERARTR